MKFIPVVAVSLFISLLWSCQLKMAPEREGVSDSVEQSAINLGGILAEQTDRLSSDKSLCPEATGNAVGSLRPLTDRLQQLKQAGVSTPPDDFMATWREKQHAVLANFEVLDENTLASWRRLNAELLRYFGAVCFADELERIFYNSRYADVVNDSSLKSTCYTRRYDRIYVNLYTSSTFDFVHTTGGNVRLIQETAYPNEGKISIKFELDDKRYVDLFIRIPEWAQTASVTGKGVKYPVYPGEYTEIASKWKTGDQVEVLLGMKPQIIGRANDRWGFSFGPLLLTYQADSLPRHTGTNNPLAQLQMVSPPGKMPTFTYAGIPEHTLVLQPFYAESNGEKRTVWIK
ncbi:beta-L-arabinofuranosidase domain-containing protein [Mangrovibacterium marinum]|uniref:Beta-L-arabinofuranosidase (Glycosyl hydrolase family 127) n=1 Tax=Mangrovibacterium marinum TaxID=1639118 RepID=A0A2T5C448_9BACT|nr:beta-L-arabinofuranosidase domain-containing protein [Mangrovibacterium marinum]PTN09579.1 beta-L-arabinofuranosidase (glycosyl hydrolase family 127) [Mangrovibacterium marinum]